MDKMKEVFSELKKVTWPTFPKVIKNTGVVLAVVLVFLLVITGIDAGLLALMKLVPANDAAAAVAVLLGL